MPQVLQQAAPQTDGPNWHYRLLIAKQADLVDTDTTASVTIPAGWRVTGATAHFRVSGKQVTTTVNATTVTVATPLVEDLLLDVTLSST